jgi:hypothetical protein
METYTYLFRHPAWLIALILLLACFGAAEVGYRLSKRGDPSTRRLKKEHISAVQTAIAALLGLLLAFTVSMSVGRFESRKLAVVDEANAIGTGYLRTQLLPEPYHTQAADTFERYTDVRLAQSADWVAALDLKLRAEQSALQQQLWSYGVTVGEQDPRAVTTGLYISAINEVIDSAGRRDAGLRNHIPETVLYVIIVITVVSLGLLGYTGGVSGNRSLTAGLVMSVVIVAVVFIIMDFDRPSRGTITVSPQAIIDARAAMDTAPPGQ